MSFIKLKNKILLGLSAVALTFGGFASLTSTKTISRSASASSSFLVKKPQGLGANFSYLNSRKCNGDEKWYPFPISRCLKYWETPPSSPYDSIGREIEDVDEALSSREKELKELKEKIAKTNELLEEISKIWEPKES